MLTGELLACVIDGLWVEVLVGGWGLVVDIELCLLVQVIGVLVLHFEYVGDFGIWRL